jgi:hypothetical protein
LRRTGPIRRCHHVKGKVAPDRRGGQKNQNKVQGRPTRTHYQAIQPNTGQHQHNIPLYFSRLLLNFRPQMQNTHRLWNSRALSPHPNSTSFIVNWGVSRHADLDEAIRIGEGLAARRSANLLHRSGTRPPMVVSACQPVPIPQLLRSNHSAIVPLVMRGPTTAFAHRGLSPIQFTAMSGAPRVVQWTRRSRRYFPLCSRRRATEHRCSA